ncbi:MAG: hypothetical protein KF866_12240 [Phycisphaeraceae bacterium]|nr:hypothetical protein [Phycisphaeraceae bacterium]MCW5755304.1 hypothetical protein [Phycisphaeraceae bacterium]
MTSNTGIGRSEGESLKGPTVTRLLQLGIAGPRRPVDALLDRLGAADGPAWFAQLLQRHPIRQIGDPLQTLVHGRVDMTALERLKEASKRLLQDAISENDRLAGLGGYFLSIAAGVEHHGRNISSRPAQELHVVLLDLAAVAPMPWSDLLASAAMKALPMTG